MGVTESRVLAENVLTACQRAEKDGKPILDNTSLWSNEDTCKAAKSIYRYIPQSIRGPSRQSTIKKAIMRSRKRLIIPPVIQELQDKREDLFPSGQRDVSFTAFPSQNNPLAHYYELVVQFENRLDLDRVRLRLLYVAFYRLKQDQHPGSQYEYYDPTPIAQAIFETGSIKDPLETILVKVRTWIGYGERYSLLATDLGGLGVLYILPDIAGESLWTKELPKSANHANRISIIKTLKKLGISEEARERGLHMSADAEVSQIFMSLKDSLGGRQRPPESHNSDRKHDSPSANQYPTT
ncbi:hypothetical protein BJX63DRAFT_441608 [Aspergillus granulosus]|uniref:Uncharacterized protein n=1 Tax=Aspergillus granulosus TaxID=176169 RepID=A0ABR4GSB7_9EURO